MKILFVAMPNSIHTARWINQLKGTNWDIHLFPVYEDLPHPELKNITIHNLYKPVGNIGEVKPVVYTALKLFNKAYNLAAKTFLNNDQALRLSKVIKKVKPDIIHSLEMQHAGYLTLASKFLLKNSFPKWIYSCWGSDIFYFQQFPEHRKRIIEVLSSCDYLFTDCYRDVELAKKYGFRGTFLGVFPGVGGYKIDVMRTHMVGNPSERKNIMVKGYNGWVYRPETLLGALEKCREQLQGFTVNVYSADGEVQKNALNMGRKMGIEINILPRLSHLQMIEMFGKSRISLGSSISDGTPNSMLEAMVMGAFPIQSDTISTSEWIQSGRNGFLANPEDVYGFAKALREALSNDTLVDSAADFNYKMLKERIDYSNVQPMIVEAYEKVFNTEICR